MLCFTNCLLPLDLEGGHGGLAQKDLWVDDCTGAILDPQSTFYLRKQRPDRIIDLGGNILCPGFLDIQINGAYGFDFSVCNGDDSAYTDGLKNVAERILETGVTSLVPTVVTQEKSLYPKLLSLLRPFSPPNTATLLGWHAEGPFLDPAKRGAHAPSFLLNAPAGYTSFEDVYGAENLVDAKDWLSPSVDVGVRIITAAPEVKGVMDAVEELTDRGIVFSIGHSIATTDIATAAVSRGARLITHLFNAMPQLHHRDPSIIGLLGASSPNLAISSPSPSRSRRRSPDHARSFSPHHIPRSADCGSEALDDVETPPLTPGTDSPSNADGDEKEIRVAGRAFQRPFYEMIVDGIHSHPNSVRLAYSAYPEGCILITDAMKILDPHLRDGIHEWRDGKRFIKEGDRLYLEGTTTLAGSVVTMDKCVRNFARFTGCSLAEAIKCVTYNPANPLLILVYVVFFHNLKADNANKYKKRCLRIENKKGTLRPGADADLVVLDRNGHVMSTWVKGKKVWDACEKHKM